MLGPVVEAAVERAVMMRSRRGPVARWRRQGWMLEFEGAFWARRADSWSKLVGTGWSKKKRVVWRDWTKWVKVEGPSMLEVDVGVVVGEDIGVSDGMDSAVSFMVVAPAFVDDPRGSMASLSGHQPCTCVFTVTPQSMV